MKKIRIKHLFYFLAAAGLLIFLHYAGISSPAESLAQQAVKPLSDSFYSFSSAISSIYSKQIEKSDLTGDYDKLKKETDLLIAENAKLKSLAEENEILREHLNFLKNKKENYILANIISRGSPDDPVMRGKIIIIDKGSKDGLFPGLAVLSGQGIAVGKISSVKDNFSEAYLISNPACKIAAKIMNKNKTSGIIQGELGLTVQMNLIPQTEEINKGDIIATSGLERDIPGGLAIGKVIKVTKESNDLWQSAAIEPLADLGALTIVSVLLP